MPQYSDVYIGHKMTVKDSVVDFGGSFLRSASEPVSSSDVATKNYVDTNRQQQGSNLRAYTDNAVAVATSAFQSADLSLKTALEAEIAVVQSQVSGILAGSTVDLNSLKEIADLAKALDSAETASLTSAVAGLQSQITSNGSDISDLKTLTASYLTEIDTALIVMPTLEIKDSQWGNGIQNDANGNLFINCPTPNGSAIICSKDTWFQTDYIGTTTFPAVKYIKPVDMQNNAIKSLPDAVDASDATAYHQLTDYQASNDAAVATVVSNLGIEAFARDSADNTLQSNIDTNYSNTVKLDGTELQTINSDISVLNFTVNGLSCFNSTFETFDLVKHHGAVVFGADANICLNDNNGPFLKSDGFHGWAAASRSDDVAQYGQLQSEISRALAAEQALTARVLVLEGQISALYQYIFNSSPTVPPVR